jgi:hypothetical protein
METAHKARNTTRNNVHADPQGPFFLNRNTEMIVRKNEINKAATSPEYI